MNWIFVAAYFLAGLCVASLLWYRDRDEDTTIGDLARGLLLVVMWPAVALVLLGIAWRDYGVWDIVIIKARKKQG